ncbi:hypothetical protein, partial [Euzebya tangerina]|uniref:beta strand repeat-containing protein n=1 Tax=Euzebya tangerina TaxID=591198 RepID=UPI002F2D2449
AVAYTDNTGGTRTISLNLTAKVTTTDSIQVYFTADAPTTADAGVDFTSTVDDTTTPPAAQATTEGSADGDGTDANSWTVTTSDATAVSSATAEISPNDIDTGSTGNEYVYAILATIGPVNTGVDSLTITVPGTHGLPTVDSVRVGGTAVAYTDNTGGTRTISLNLTAKVVTTDSIQVYFTADAPSSADAGVDFTSTVDDKGTAEAAQATTEGSADGDGADANSWTVTTTNSTPAVTSATAEIAPNDVTTGFIGIEYIYAILATISGGETGVDRVEIEVPSTFGLPTVDSVRVGGTAVTYTDNTGATRTISVDLTAKVTTTDSIQVYFTADAPALADPSGKDFTSTVDDSGTGSPAQATTEGNGDGDAGDANDWTVTATDIGGGGGTPAGICPAVDTVFTFSTITDSMVFQHTTTSGPDRLMLVGISINNDDLETVSSITYNGTPLSKLATETNVDDARVEIWQLVAPAAGTHDVIIAFSGDLLLSAVAGAITFTGADQTPIASADSAFADSPTSSVTVSSAVGELVFAMMSGETTGTPTLQNSPPAVEQWNLVETSAPPDEYGAAATDTGQVSVTVSWTHADDHWAAAGASIAPATACLNAAPTISSNANQSFGVGDPVTVAERIVITEDASYMTITSPNDVRITIPAGLDMIWDTLLTTVTIGGASASKVSATLLPFEDAGKTAVINITGDFAGGDQFYIDSLKFMSFGSISAADNLELEVGNDDVVSALDDKTKEITAPSNPAATSATAEISPNDVVTSSNGNDFVYAILPVIGGSDTGVDSIEITVPATFGDPTVDSVRVGGTAVAYTDYTAAKLINIKLTVKVTATDSIQVYFNSIVPTSSDATGVAFTSIIDDSGTGYAAQATAEGDADGDAADDNIWTVTTSGAASSILAEISPNDVLTSSTGNEFIYAI